MLYLFFIWNLCFYFVSSKYSGHLSIVEERLSRCGLLAHMQPSGSTTGYYQRMKTCFLDDILICTEKQPVQTVAAVNRAFHNADICGILGSQFVNSHLPWKFHLDTSTNYIMKVNVLLFRLPWLGMQCPSYAMTIRGVNEAEDTQMPYCGKRMPWLQMYDNECVLTINGPMVHSINIYIFFSVMPYYIRMSYLSYAVYETSAMFNLRAFATFLTSTVGVILRVITKPYMLMQIEFKNKNETHFVELRDGPGRLSTQIEGLIVLSSAYIVSIYLKSTAYHLNCTIMYQSLHIMKREHRPIFPCKQIGGMRSLQDYGESSVKLKYNSSLYKRNMACHIFYSSYSDLEALNFPRLNIKHYTFFGNTIYNESLPVGCQYGGLFAYSITRSGTLEEITQYCNNLDDELPPFLMSEHQSLLVAMVWYSSYSYGVFEGYIDMVPCIYRNIDVAQSQQLSIPHVINYNTSCEFIFLDSSANKMKEYYEENITISITSEKKVIGPIVFDFHFKLKNNLPHSKINDCIHQVAFNMTFYEEWLHYPNHSSAEWKVHKYPIYNFNVLKDIAITVSTCLLSIGGFVVVLEKPFCHEEGKVGRAAELVDNSMTLLKRCSKDMLIPLYNLPQLKFVTLPEAGYHKKVIKIKFDTSCSTECSRHTLRLLEYVPDASILCEYSVELNGHTNMELISMHAHEGFLITLRDRVDIRRKYLCSRTNCYPILSTIVKQTQKLDKNRFTNIKLFHKR